jgi:hypothetical protein
MSLRIVGLEGVKYLFINFENNKTYTFSSRPFCEHLVVRILSSEFITD